MKNNNLKIIVTGATGMVGEGVLHECLNSTYVDHALVISRKSLGFEHPKLAEIVHKDFLDLSSIQDQLSGYDACYHCLGVSSVGISADDYYRVTYSLTMHLAEILCARNPRMTFCYVSGMGTDSTEKGRSRWARVKGKTENDLMKLPFEQVFAYRPGFMKPTSGLKNALPYYKYLNWIFPIGKKIYPVMFNTLAEVGQSMINVTRFGYDKKIIDGVEISKLAVLKEPE